MFLFSTFGRRDGRSSNRRPQTRHCLRVENLEGRQLMSTLTFTKIELNASAIQGNHIGVTADIIQGNHIGVMTSAIHGNHIGTNVA